MVAIELIEATEAHFAWLLGGPNGGAFAGLVQPDGGVDRPEILTLLRDIAARQGGFMWLIVCEGEVCGLCGYMKPPSQGRAEIGYGVAPALRGRGLASQAVTAMIANAAPNGMTTLTAGTARNNRASQVVLERNGFVQTGTRIDAEEGEMNFWRRETN